jgi:hypothetical protein
MPGAFTDYIAPIVRNAPDGVRELAKARWGMPSSQFSLLQSSKERADEAERKRVAQAWLTLRNEHAKLQSVANAHMATRIAAARAAADAAVEAATKAAMPRHRVGRLLEVALGSPEWRIENQKSVIAERAECLQELEALLREHGLPTGPAM